MVENPKKSQRIRENQRELEISKKIGVNRSESERIINNSRES